MEEILHAIADILISYLTDKKESKRAKAIAALILFSPVAVIFFLVGMNMFSTYSVLKGIIVMALSLTVIAALVFYLLKNLKKKPEPEAEPVNNVPGQ